MFERLFSESGLSLDRLRVLVEVAAWGSIVGAAGKDPARQSQYSRQIKELEDFFQTSIVERHGKGIRLTPGGRELARISRFFLMGLSNFRSGCLAESQAYRIGAPPSFLSTFLLPLLSESARHTTAIRFVLEPAFNDEIERRLHDLTLDFGIVTRSPLSRPLEQKQIRSAGVRLWVPRSGCRNSKDAVRAFSENRLRLVMPVRELGDSCGDIIVHTEPVLVCDNFLQVRDALQNEGLAGPLPEFLAPPNPGKFLAVQVPGAESAKVAYFFAWNPRLLRLNPHAIKRRDSLVSGLTN